MSALDKVLALARGEAVADLDELTLTWSPQAREAALKARISHEHHYNGVNTTVTHPDGSTQMFAFHRKRAGANNKNPNYDHTDIAHEGKNVGSVTVSKTKADPGIVSRLDHEGRMEPGHHPVHVHSSEKAAVEHVAETAIRDGVVSAKIVPKHDPHEMADRMSQSGIPVPHGLLSDAEKKRVRQKWEPR